MAEISTTVKMRKLTHQVTMTVRVIDTHEFKIRRWLALQLIRLATIVLDCGLEVVD